MIVSSDITNYMSTPTVSNMRMSNSITDTDADAQNGGNNADQQTNQRPAPTSTKVVTESDGSTMMQYTSTSPGGAIMRKNVMLHQADAFSSDPLNPTPMLRRRSDAYENMMQIF